MKPSILLLFFILLSGVSFSQEINPYTCTYKGKKLYGKVRVVESSPDFRVKVVNSSENISIQKTDHTPTRCGEWNFVENGEDFKIQFVTNSEDFTIRYTNGNTAINNSSSNRYIKKIDPSNCTFHGIPLKGKVKIVTSFADFSVKKVDSFQDISIKVVDNFPDDCGEWQFVDSFPDFTIKFVDSFPDIEIKFVENFPGLK